MTRFQGSVNVGLREKGTDKLVAVYPHKLEGSDNEIENRVKFWFYQQSCSAENKLQECYVDVVSEDEIKERKDHLR
ncbi:MAG: hypothetical protein N3I35_00555 [Clostridia bacterium]|nr:hypothetical protein [Clostridia bacterium]